MDFMPAYVYGTGNEVQGPKDRPEGSHACDGCNGSGVYYGRGSVVNGQFVGFKGKCYRCHGKGWQHDKDLKRNRYYDNHVRRWNV